MSDHPATSLIDLPDHVVLTKPQVRAITTLSDDTLDRLHQCGEGPERIQLSPRRVGYRAGSLRTWMQNRSST
jgi:predicted DNA-binding transcriptional regulator AlpA